MAAPMQEVIDPTVDPEDMVLEPQDHYFDDFGDDSEDLSWTVKKSRKNKQTERKAGGKGQTNTGGGRNGMGSLNAGDAANAEAHFQQRDGHRGRNGEGNRRNLDVGQGYAVATVGNRFDNLQPQGGAGGAARNNADGAEQDPFARPTVPVDRPSSGNAYKPTQQSQQRPPRQGRSRR